MRRTLIAFVAAVLCGLAYLTLVGSRPASEVVQTLGVLPLTPVAELRAGQELCEAPIALVEAVDAIGFNAVSLAQPTPRITVSLRDGAGGRTFMRVGLDPRSSLDADTVQVVRFDAVKTREYVKLCFTNEGPAKVRILGDRLGGPGDCTPSGRRADHVPVCRPGGVRPTITTAAAAVDGEPVEGDVSATFFRRGGERSLLQRLPAIPQRASRFRPAYVTPALWWALFAGWLVGLPVAVGFALSRALSARGRESAPRSPGSRRAT